MFVGSMSPANDTVAIPFLIFVLVFMPVSGVLSWYRLRTHEPRGTKKQRYLGTIGMQLWLLGFSVLIAQHENIDLFPTFSASSLWWSLSALFLLLMMRSLWFKWGKIDAERKRRIARLLPETPQEMKYWSVISLLAGIGEECSFRGVAFTLLLVMTGSALAALIVCVVTFAIAHMSQGWRGALGAGVLAMMFHGMVAVTGSLYLAMAFHVAYDLFLGVVLMRLFQRDKAALPEVAQITERPA